MTDDRWGGVARLRSVLGHWSSVLFLVLPIALSLSKSDGAAGPHTTTVGMPAKLEQLVLPGPELEVKPIDEFKTPIVIRIADVYPHGSAFRYDLVYYGLKPGSYDLSKFLRRKDGSPSDGVPPVNVTIRAVLPPGQIEPNRVEAAGTPSLGGYRRLLEVGGMLWSAGLVAILYLTRQKPSPAEAAKQRPQTLSDRLRPLVEAAIAGTLGPERHAELERLIIGYWRRRLGLEHADPAAAIAALRRHDDAGPVIQRLEDWLHRPGGSGNVDVAEFLRPYLNIPADEPVAEPVDA